MARINQVLFSTVFCAAFAAAGCHHDGQATTTGTTTASSSSTAVADTSSMTPEDLGKLGAEINRNPADAGKLLNQHGLTRQSFEQAIRKVSSSPAESKRYAAAYKSAS